METKYLQIAYPNSEEGGWLLRLQARLRKSSSETIRTRAGHWRESGLAEKALIFLTKHNLFRHVLQSLKKELEDFDHALSGKKAEITTLLEIGGGMNLGDKPFGLILLVDAFFFELKAASELLRDFLLLFLETIFEESVSKSQLKERLDENSVPLVWLEHLKSERDYLSHNGSAWPVLKVVDPASPKMQLILKKTILNKGDNEGDVISIDKLQMMLQSFQNSLYSIERWLIKEVESRENQERDA